MTRMNNKIPGEKKDGETERMTRNLKMVFICSPFHPTGDTKEERDADFDHNINRTISACREAVEKGYVPYAPHLYFPQFLDDNNKRERSLGIQRGLFWLAMCDEVWVVGTRINRGMQVELDSAHELGIPVRHLVILKPNDRDDSRDDGRDDHGNEDKQEGILYEEY